MEKEKRTRRTGRRVALDILFAALIVFLIVASFVDFSKRVRSSVHENAEQTLREMNQEGALLLETQVQRDFEFLHSLAAIMVADGSVDNPEMVIRNLGLGRDNYSFDRMSYIKADGMAYTSAGEALDQSGCDYFKRAMTGENAVSGILFFEQTGKDGFAVAVPVYRDGAIIGVLSGSYLTETFSNVVNMEVYGGQSITYVVQPDGSYILKPANNEVDVKKWSTDGDSKRSVREKMDRGESGYASFEGEGGTWRFCYVPTTINDWYVVTVVPDRVIMKQADYINQMALILGAKIGLALVFTGVYLAVNHRRNERREQERQERSQMDNARYRVLLENMDALFFEWDLQDNTLTCSQGWQEQMGYTPRLDDIENGGIVDTPESLSFIGFLESVRGGLEHGEEEYQVLRADTSTYWCRVRLTGIKDHQGRVRRIMGLIEDIDARKKREAQLVNQASRDSLTNLYNKKATEEQITFILKNEQRETYCHGFFLLDIDDFKAINDTYGHSVGDQVLRDLADCLLRLFRSTDVVGRIGGDEFAIFLRNAGAREDILKRARELIAEFRRIPVSGEQYVSCSLGVVIAERGEKDFKSLYSHADAAMYEAKRKGKNQYAVYETNE
ncbi:diguanylate cyclase [Eubacterium sp. 1001713B170207_170306_E7]|uniref:sensor domain-containing diguanylate cyclase n=1 Tax=Eubacterium sp. 1001713B170207_170306_E7 TaxID=2787097 RepID=UPI00189A5404|nr:diguanylate cyclase [Eubacterium sp. 1001713B170207_170306_E7]